jgi:surface carbohydrate biosynthesis protein
MRKLLVIIDHPQRDLPGLLAFALHPELHNNYKVYLASSSSNLDQTIARLRPSVILWHAISQSLLPLFSFARFLGAINVVHPTEGIFYDDYEFYSLHNTKVLSFVDVYMSWGKHQIGILKKILTDRGLNTRLVDSGSLRYDYINSLPKLYSRTSTLPRVILWNTNFPFISPRYQELGEEFSEAVNVHKIGGLSHCLSTVINSAVCRHHALEALASLTQKVHVALKIRPHPFESACYYHDSLPKLNCNVEIYRDTDLHLHDLNKCDLIVSSGCQTVLDCYFRGVPSFTFSRGFDNLWRSCSLPFSDLEMSINHDVLDVAALLDKQRALFRSNGVDEYLSNLFLPSLNISTILNFLNHHPPSTASRLLSLRFCFFFPLKLLARGILDLLQISYNKTIPKLSTSSLLALVRQQVSFPFQALENHNSIYLRLSNASN